MAGNYEVHGNNGEDLCRGDRGDDWIAGGDGFDELIGDEESVMARLWAPTTLSLILSICGSTV